MDAKNVLIFPGGSEIAFEIVNALKYSKFVRLFGGTSTNDHSEFVFENLITDFPFISDDHFISYLNKVIHQYKIDAVYPAHDSVCLFLCEHRDEIDAPVVVTEYETVRICRSKKETYHFLQKESFIPQMYESVSEVTQYPVFVKPAVGQGSEGAKKIESEDMLKLAVDRDDRLIICEYLPGTEYTVDCFTDSHKTLRIVKQRRRDRIRTGISVRSQEVPVDNQVYQIAQTLNEYFHFQGAWFFQIRENAQGEYKLLEVSPRIPGTMGLSRNLGINFAMLTLFDMWGFDVDLLDNGYDITLDRAFYSAYRTDCKYQYIYLDYDDTLIISDKVNNQLISFLYQAISNGKKIILLSKHAGDIVEDLKRYRISSELFDEIIILEKNEQKTDYIKETDAIFIDDSFAERKRVWEKLHIPVFDLDMVECLIDWRS